MINIASKHRGTHNTRMQKAKRYKHVFCGNYIIEYIRIHSSWNSNDTSQ